MKPTVGRIVHYVSYGTPGGEFGSECRAAIIAGVKNDQKHLDVVDLVVFNPQGIFFNRVPYNAGAEVVGDPECPLQGQHGNPFRYCSCGWTEAWHPGGTWHWPERENEAP